MDTKPHAELPPLETNEADTLNEHYWTAFKACGFGNDDYEVSGGVAIKLAEWLSCRERQLLAALQSIASLTARAEKAERGLTNVVKHLELSGSLAMAGTTYFIAKRALDSLRTNPSEGGDGYDL